VNNLVAPVGDGAWPQEISALAARCTFPPPPARLVCAVSGGADSLALLVLACAAGLEVEAVHVDHGLREGSAEEAERVASAARRFGATFRAEVIDVGDGPNLEARARAARFSVLPPDVATGHTMDDQAVTVLSNLLRGAGLDGAGAMQAGRLHPLLGLRRSETEEVCRVMGLKWFSDPSNEDARHLRNRIRGELLPLCGELARRDPVPILARSAAVVRDEASLLDELARSAVPDPADAKALSRAPTPLARRAVRQWLRDAPGAQQTGGRSGPGDSHPPTLAEVNRVLAVAAGDAVGTELAGGRTLRRHQGRLVVNGDRSDKVGAMQTKAVSSSAPAWAANAIGAEIVSESALAHRVNELAAQITSDYAGDPPLLVGVLKGAMIFMSDLARAIALPVDVDFMAVSSYGSATKTSGVVRIVKDLDAVLTDRHVLVVEDIIDSGLTLNYLRKYLSARRPASVEVCALLVKEGQQRVDLDLRYVGFTIPPAFVVGYGLDVAERYRNLPGIFVYTGEDDLTAQR
jgi:hypoxanthine phosphoribosyltransferase